MHAKKYNQSYQCKCRGRDCCSCPYNNLEKSYTLFTDNTQDIAKTLSEIMVVCGIHQCKAKGSIDVILNLFQYYDDKRHSSIDAEPRKRLSKEQLLRCLGRKCLMTRLETQLAYTIIKRAFKAFYHGSCPTGIRNPLLEAQLIYTQESAWVHAAKRTAQLFSCYERVFFAADKNYEKLIKQLYKELYNRMKVRTDPLVFNERLIHAEQSVTEAPKLKKPFINLSDSRMSDESEDSNYRTLPVDTGEVKMKVSRLSNNPGQVPGSIFFEETKKPNFMAYCYKCCRPRLICECDVDQETGLLKIDCSQGPFKCQWTRVENQKIPRDPDCLDLSSDHECPVDCDGDSILCFPECVCESCECSVEESESDYDTESVDTKAEEEGFNGPSSSSDICRPKDVWDLEPNPYFDNCRVPLGEIREQSKESVSSLIEQVVGPASQEKEAKPYIDSDDEDTDDEPDTVPVIDPFEHF